MENGVVSRAGISQSRVLRQFRILRQKGTEMAGTGEYEKFKGQGIFDCAACGAHLYKTSDKFDSGCGWPAFAEGYVVLISC
jgi:peptide-methionine (R)-S-oxide reductase